MAKQKARAPAKKLSPKRPRLSTRAPSVRPKAGTTKAGAAQRKKDFVNMYFIYNQNGTEAAKACGFNPRTAANQACVFLKDHEIIKMIQERRDKLSEITALTAEEVVRSLARAMNFDPGKLYNADGSLKKIHEIDEDTRLELVGADIDQIIKGRGDNRAVVTTSKVKYANKSIARDQAMKHFGLYKKDNEQAGAALGRALVTLYLPKNGREKS